MRCITQPHITKLATKMHAPKPNIVKSYSVLRSTFNSYSSNTTTSYKNINIINVGTVIIAIIIFITGG